MTHYTKYIFRKLMTSLLALLVLSSCEGLLDEEPKSVAEEVFYNTAEEVEAAVNAIYSPIRISTMANYIATLECHSDWMYGRGSWDPLSQYQGLNDANINRVSGFWNGFYQSIRNANLVIRNAPQGSSISEEDVTRFVAEAKFLRAFNYFQLVRNWGGLPLRTENNMEEKDVPRSDENAVYELILSDLLAAEAGLPDDQQDVGRPTVWAAKTLLSEVYLQLGRYAEAAAKADEVIASGKFSLVKVSSREELQYNLFGPEILRTPEEIFYLKYSRLEGHGNYILWISNHPSTGYFSFGGAYAVHGNATNPNYQNWDNGDLRKQLWDQIDFGLGPNTLVSGKYVDPDAISQSGAGNDQPLYRYADVLLNHAEADARATGQVSPAALESLNQVRRRAYGFDPLTASPADYSMEGLTEDAFVDLVIKERGYEFVYEGKRWLELKRTGKAEEYIQVNKGKTIAAPHYLWPIPVSELNYNKALDPVGDQNPGY